MLYEGTLLHGLRILLNNYQSPDMLHYWDDFTTVSHPEFPWNFKGGKELCSTHKQSALRDRLSKARSRIIATREVRRDGTGRDGTRDHRLIGTGKSVIYSWLTAFNILRYPWRKDWRDNWNDYLDKQLQLPMTKANALSYNTTASHLSSFQRVHQLSVHSHSQASRGSLKYWLKYGDHSLLKLIMKKAVSLKQWK